MKIFYISNKTFIDAKPFRIRFDQIDGFIRICDEIRYLTLFGSKEYETIYNRITYFTSQKSGITYIFSHYFAKKKIKFKFKFLKFQSVEDSFFLLSLFGIYNG